MESRTPSTVDKIAGRPRFSPDWPALGILVLGLCTTGAVGAIWIGVGYIEIEDSVAGLAMLGLLPFWCCLATWIVDGIRHPPDSLRRLWLRVNCEGIVLTSWVNLALVRARVHSHMRLDMLDVTMIPAYFLLGLFSLVGIPWIHRKSE